MIFPESINLYEVHRLESDLAEMIRMMRADGIKMCRCAFYYSNCPACQIVERADRRYKLQEQQYHQQRQAVSLLCPHCGRAPE